MCLATEIGLKKMVSRWCSETVCACRGRHFSRCFVYGPVTFTIICFVASLALTFAAVLCGISTYVIIFVIQESFKLIDFTLFNIFTKFAKVMFLHLSVSHSVQGGWLPSMHWEWGVCIQRGSAFRGGRAVYIQEEGGLHPGKVWQNLSPPKTHGILQDTVNERAVRILLECVLVYIFTVGTLLSFSSLRVVFCLLPV